MAESLSLLRTRIRRDIWERIAEADLSFMWAIFDADTSPGKQLKEVKSRMVSVEEGINRLEARMMEAASSQACRTDAMSHRCAVTDVTQSTQARYLRRVGKEFAKG